MIIKSTLFSSGHFCRGTMLPDVLRAHKEKTIRKIQSIVCLDDMTESFLKRVVKESIVDVLTLKLNDTTKETRSEGFRSSEMPYDLGMYCRDPYKSYPKTVVRIRVPFEGDRSLLDYCPSSQTTCLPIGQVSGNAIEFDEVFWRENDPQDVKNRIAENLDRIKLYVDRSNDDVNKFNESLPKEMEEAFSNKLAQLERQIASLDDLGIADMPKKEQSDVKECPVQKRQKQGERVILMVRNFYVDTFNQINKNDGNVNNAIQSS